MIDVKITGALAENPIGDAYEDGAYLEATDALQQAVAAAWSAGADADSIGVTIAAGLTDAGAQG